MGIILAILRRGTAYDAIAAGFRQLAIALIAPNAIAIATANAEIAEIAEIAESPNRRIAESPNRRNRPSTATVLAPSAFP